MLYVSTFALLVPLVSAVYNPNHRQHVSPPVLPQKVLECPGNRRLVPCPFNARINECSINNGCGAGRICCRDECGAHICRSSGLIPEPPIIRVKDCPNNRKFIRCPLILRINECTSINDCKHGQHCCRDECGTNICRTSGIIPIPPRVKDCPGNRDFAPCLAIFRPDECTSNSNCEHGQHCCRDECGRNICRNSGIIPIPPRVKDCPRNRDFVPCLTIFRPDECTSNNECEQGQHCCRDECGRNICRNSGIIPQPPRVRDCPRNRDFIRCTAIVRLDECISSRECGQHEICCRGECGANICQAREIFPPIVPRPPVKRCVNEPVGINCLFTPVRHECFSNRDCRSDNCCRNSCGSNVCQVRTTTPPLDLGRCPIIGRPVDCRLAFFLNECERNSDCESGSCCINECGARQCRRDRQIPFSV